MIRIIICALSLGLAVPAFAQSAADCAVFGQIAEQAAEARRSDGEMMDTMVVIAESFTGSQERFRGAVPHLVDWVWKLPANQLDAGVGAAYRTECEAQYASQ